MPTDVQSAIVPHRFAEQVAVVTGAASGIGLHVARRLLAEGAVVHAWDRDARALDAAWAGAERVHPAAVDIADEAAVKAGFDAVATRDRQLDALVHCAGIVGSNNRTILETDVDAFDNVCRVNLRGSFLVTKHAAALMVPRRYGRILLFASIAGKEGNAGMTPYSASKAGVIGLVKAAGKELATTGVTVNAIAPGVVRTPLVDAMSAEQVSYMTDKIPMKRTGTLEETASLACWIVSREASFSTAFTFDLSGGRATY